MKSNLICVVLAFCLASSLATDYTFVSTAGGSWKTASNWNPQGVPGVEDNVLFTYLDYGDEIVVTLDGDITVNSLTMDTHGYLLKSGTITVQNDCLVNAGTFYKINITLNGNSSFESTGSGGFSGILCDSCVINVKNSLNFRSKQTGNTEITNRAMVVTWAGASTTIWYDSMHSAMDTPLSTFINYGTLIFGNGFGSGSSPWGNPPVTETGPWHELRNYGDIRVQIQGSPLGSFVYNDFQTWNFLDGKITLRVVQESSTNAEGKYSSESEFNDGIGPCATQEYYEVNIGGDVHVLFDKAETLPGQPEKPFDPKVGDFFPVFSSFQNYTGKFRKITSEGLGSGMALGRMTKVDPNNGYFHVGVVICADTDTTCISGSGTPSGSQSPSGSVSPIGSKSPDGSSPINGISSARALEVSFTVAIAFVAMLF